MDLEQFRIPPPGYGEVAFFWWHGDAVTKEKLSWILEQLKDSHISGLQINYAHDNRMERGGHPTLWHSPRVFSEDWWDLVGWFMRECKAYHIAVSLSDYTLTTPGQGFYTDMIRQEHPEMLGQQLVLHDGSVSVETVADSLNPMAPGVGQELVKNFYQQFENHFPGESGQGINFFFSDELKFNVRGNLWCEDFPQEFQKRKGYSLFPYINAIFEDIGAITPKIRLDYYDVVVALSEERYFKPVYDWHQSHGMIFGCDHGGRGQDVTEFGDYFRAMRWYQGPGNDQPHLESNIIKNKVSSSIAHLYQRPRTWLEGFYGSGWGTSSAQVADAVFRNFAMGHNLLSLHGLYYSMQGSMWEWAPPCNHYHMPYWPEMKALLGCTERLSYLMTRGVHRCDVAVYYPVCAVEADPQRGEQSVRTAFGAATALYQNGVDFDFIDFQSIERSRVEEGGLCISGEQYRMVVLPDMKAIRFAAYQRLAEFARAGGQLVFLGEMPQESDHAGRNDSVLERLNHELGALAPSLAASDYRALLQRLDDDGPRDFYCAGSMPFIQHRVMGEEELYYVYGVEAGNCCRFRSRKRPWLLDPWSGNISPVRDWAIEGEITTIKTTKGSKELQLFLFSDQDYGAYCPNDGEAGQKPVRLLDCEGTWETEIVPTLDNAYGDYRLPPSAEKLGPALIRLKYCQTEQDCRSPILQDAGWATGEVDHGPQFRLREPDGSEQMGCFSWKNGVAGDAGNQHSYHGLKGFISDDFLCMGTKQLLNMGSNSRYEGDGWYEVETWCNVQQPCRAFWDFGEKLPEEIYLDGKPTLPEQTVWLTPGLHPVRLRYRDGGRTHFLLRTGAGHPTQEPLTSRWYRDESLLKFDAEPEQCGKPCWYRFVAPPGLQKMRVITEGETTVYAEGKPMKPEGDGWFSTEKGLEHPAKIALCICQKSGYYACGAIREPIRFQCGKGLFTLGDWSENDGLRNYSGGICYKKAFHFSAEELSQTIVLDLGTVISACRVMVNGQQAAILAAPPYQTDISRWLKIGDNEIEILVHNTLANHMSAYPTAYGGTLTSGLLGTAKSRAEKITP